MTVKELQLMRAELERIARDATQAAILLRAVEEKKLLARPCPLVLIGGLDDSSHGFKNRGGGVLA